MAMDKDGGDVAKEFKDKDHPLQKRYPGTTSGGMKIN